MYESLLWVVSMYDSRWIDVPGLKHGLKQPEDESFELFKTFTLERSGDGSQSAEKQTDHACFSFRRSSDFTVMFFLFALKHTEDVSESYRD